MLLALALVAILSRGLIAPGWMPATGPVGFRVTICAGTEPMGVADAAQAAFDARLGKPAPKHTPAPDQPCAFAALSLALDRVHAFGIVALPPARVATTPTLPRAPAGIGHGLAAPPPPATGPPAFA